MCQWEEQLGPKSRTLIGGTVPYKSARRRLSGLHHAKTQLGEDIYEAEMEESADP